MNKIELDETMVEQDRINRFLNMIATEYGGNLATEYGTYYINKCKKISELDKEIDRLNNIINELERQSRLGTLENEKSNNEYAKGLATAYDYIYRLIRELKGE